MTFMRRPRARSATIAPMLPQPISPSVLLLTSTPWNFDFSHLPALVEASACGIRRAIASISEIACSAVVTELPPGVFITTTPRAVAASVSMLSTPTPARPITLRPPAASRTSRVTLVAERIAKPSKPASFCFNSSALRPVATSVSTPRWWNTSTALSDILSAIRTLGIGDRDPGYCLGEVGIVAGL